MDAEPNVSEIICADYDEKAVNDLAEAAKSDITVDVKVKEF